jgi:hypothetical protein
MALTRFPWHIPDWRSVPPGDSEKDWKAEVEFALRTATRGWMISLSVQLARRFRRIRSIGLNSSDVA